MEHLYNLAVRYYQLTDIRIVIDYEECSIGLKHCGSVFMKEQASSVGEASWRLQKTLMERLDALDQAREEI